MLATYFAQKIILLISENFSSVFISEEIRIKFSDIPLD